MKKIIILIVLCLGVNVFSMSTQEGLSCLIEIRGSIERTKADELTKENYRDAKKCGLEFLISKQILKEKKIIELNDKELRYILNSAAPNIFYERLLEEKDTLPKKTKQLIKKEELDFILEAWGIEL